MAEIRDLDGKMILEDRLVATVTELIAGIQRGDYGKVDLRRADFAGEQLSAADFRGVILDESSFVDANLTDADLRHCFARKCYFTRANLTRVRLADGEFWSSDFSNAVLSDVDGLDNADFDSACVFTAIRQPAARRVTEWEIWDPSWTVAGS